MKIFNAQQIKAWDQFTITHEPVPGIGLMERAAQQCVQWILEHMTFARPVFVFCGKGNNGGDGLAIARLLLDKGIEVHCYILEFGRLGTDDFQTNLQRLQALPAPLHFIPSEAQFPAIDGGALVVDALYGAGLSRPLDGLSAALVEHINSAGATVISIDLPSGLFMDRTSRGNTVVRAQHTLTFQCYKLALLVAENAGWMGHVHVLDIGLHPRFAAAEAADFFLTEDGDIKKIFRPRNRFAHKGTFGHALLLGGSYGKMGAAVLAATACLRAGVGLLTAYIPRCGYAIMQTTLPEAMVLTDPDEEVLTSLPPGLENYKAIGIGPGLGTAEATRLVVEQLINTHDQPMVLDADALNCLALDPWLLRQLPSHSLLTPHPKEFDRLFGPASDDFERMNRARAQSASLNMVVILKGHHTLVALPDGRAFLNATGNAGMAKGGSGDVLTGLLTALLAQGYAPVEAALLGVFLHGAAGDAAAEVLGMEAMLAGDVARLLSKAFARLYG